MYFSPDAAALILNSWLGWNISVLITKKNTKERLLSGVLRYNNKFLIVEEEGMTTKVRTIPMHKILQINAPCLHIYPQKPKIILEDDNYYTYKDVDNWIWYVAKTDDLL